MVKMKQAEGVFVADMQGTYYGEPKKKVPTFTSANMSSPIFPLSRNAQAIQTALASLGAPR